MYNHLHVISVMMY